MHSAAALGTIKYFYAGIAAQVTPSYKQLETKNYTASGVGRCFIAGGLTIVGVSINFNAGGLGAFSPRKFRNFSCSVDQFWYNLMTDTLSCELAS